MVPKSEASGINHEKIGVRNGNNEISKTHYKDDPMSITWLSKHGDVAQKYWNKIPSSIGTFIATLAVFIMGSTFRGEWLLILVHFMKAFRNKDAVMDDSFSPANQTEYKLLGVNLTPYYLKDLGFHFIIATSISYILFLGVGGFLHWYYYVRQRDRAEEWKCQPNKWMSPELERHEIIFGSLCLLIGSTISSFLSCYVTNGGPSAIYYNISEYGWVWYLMSWPVTYIWQDYLTYWHHRFYHLPFFYKNFHKLHHKYKQPTAFSVTAIHPFEFIHMQIVQFSPMFLIPLHWSVFCTLLIYLYYHGIIDHSGINFKSYWWQPWQPDCIFHDNHHQYFHVNFGFNCEIWDKLHGTYRQKDKVYREDTFYGEGKCVDESSKEELMADLNERESENVLAHRGDVRDQQVDEIRKRITRLHSNQLLNHDN